MLIENKQEYSFSAIEGKKKKKKVIQNSKTDESIFQKERQKKAQSAWFGG